MLVIKPKARIQDQGDARIAAALMPGEEIFPRELSTTSLGPPINNSDWGHKKGDELHNDVVSR